ncbi:MAG: ABC transporter permease [Bacteroidales bacterium]|nr:ABC transporter permease [Bacteroidales bacterium]MBN2634252.1 ABC transporter permease [Bacteroidales bacterium]
MIRQTPFSLLMLFLSSLVLLFILAPLTGMFLHTAGSDLLETVNDDDVRQSIWLTLWVSFAATFVFAFVCIPLAWIMARKEFPLKSMVQGLIDLPVVLPHTAAGLAVLGFISREGVLGKAADTIGLTLVNNPAGIALAMAFVSVPFLINSARDGFAAVPERLEKAALTLGASPSRVFFTISLPIAWRSIITGFIMMFARGMSEFGAVVMVAYHPMIAPVLIYERFSSFGLAYARPVSVLFVLVALMIFIFLRLISVTRKEVRYEGNAEA